MARGPMVAYAPEGETTAAPEGPLTREQAVAMLTEAPAEQAAPEAPVEAAEEPEEIEAGDQPAEEPEEGAESAAEGEEEAEAEPVEAVEPPPYWSKDAKAKFASLDPEMQAVVLAQEGPREEITAKVKADAAAAIEAANKELAGVQTLAQQLSEFLPQALKTFQQRWGEPDWAAVATEMGADQAFVLKSQFEAEQKQLAQLQQAEHHAQTKANQVRVQTEWRQLALDAPELAPDVADPTKGMETRQKVVGYLSTRGIPKEAIDQISAVELSLAYDAMRWREAQTKLAAPPKPKPPVPAAPRAPVRPVAAAAQPSSPQRDAQRIQNRFAQTGSREDAVALIVAKGL